MAAIASTARFAQSLPCSRALHSFAVSATAQETAKKTHQKVRTVTGCLHKDGDEYELRTKSGSTWELKSDKVEIAPQDSFWLLRGHVKQRDTTAALLNIVDHKSVSIRA
jgi:hypothetical protein